jgi:drug/metabolite transporter (DMT)-like permease
LLPALAINLLIASGTFLVAKRTLAEFPPLPLTMLRFALATAVLWPCARLAAPHARIARADRPRIWLLGLLGVTLNQGLFLLGMKWASASHAALLYALTPAFVLLIGWAKHSTRPNVPQVIGIVLAFAGVVTLLVERGLHFDRHSVFGDVLVFTAVIAWAGYFVAGRGMTRRYGPLLVAGEAMLAGTVLFLPIGLVSLVGFHPGQVSSAGWIGLLYLALLTSALNYVIWFWGLQYLKAATVAMLTNLQPIVAAVLARVILGERLPPAFAVSAALVLGGVWLTRLGPTESTAPSDALASSPTSEPATR